MNTHVARPMANASKLHDVQIFRMSTAEHECPWGLKAISLLNAKGISYIDHRLISDEEVVAFKQNHGVATTPQSFAAGKRIGGYTDLAVLLGSKAEGAEYSYTPVIAVFGTTLLMALVVGGGILQLFMGFSICMLAMLKLIIFSVGSVASNPLPRKVRNVESELKIVSLAFKVGIAATSVHTCALSDA